ncbi:MAG: DUF4831 family protein [Bacteroidales bacterium]|nr:DUF4831 family protein [Bacteroidales bacterium]
MRQTLLVLLVSIITISGFAQISVRKVAGNTDLSGKQGLFYALPSTYIKVELKLQKIEYLAGPYAEYAAKYLDMDDVITSDYDEYAILDAVISTVSVPDADQVFFATMDDKVAKEGNAVLFSLTQSGLAYDLRGNLPEKPFANMASLNIQSDAGNRDLFKYFAETNLYQQYDTIIRKVVVDTVTVEKIYLDQKWVEKTDEQKAVEAANKISQIRQARYNLISGYQEIAYEASTVAYMDQQLQKLEKEYMTLFTGISLNKTFSYTFFVKPTEPNETVPVCVFSERSGIKAADASGGEKIQLVLESTGDFSAVQSVVNKRNSANPDNQGFYYRIPVMTHIKMALSKDLKVDVVFPISQFGVVTYLPPSATSVQFYESTGGVKSLLIK